MRKLDLTTMQSEELWLLYEELTKILTQRVIAEKRELETRLAKLNRIEIVGEVGDDLPSGNNLPSSLSDRAPRRKYPKVFPKYCNPLATSQTWSGRGKKPKWVVAALKKGQTLEDLKIERVKKKRSNARDPRT
jgi:DNA-binding protein H-NS